MKSYYCRSYGFVEIRSIKPPSLLNNVVDDVLIIVFTLTITVYLEIKKIIITDSDL